MTRISRIHANYEGEHVNYLRSKYGYPLVVERSRWGTVAWLGVLFVGACVVAWAL